jgi:thiol-disulfide isomerase/thioredoxin
MQRVVWLVCCVVLAVTLVTPRLCSPPLEADTTAPAARAVKPFRLDDAAGKPWALADAKGKKAVVVLFLGTECPINNQYLPTLAKLSKAYADKGVPFVAINSNAHDTPTRILAHVKTNGLPFPVLKDTGNVVADDFGARRTPEAFVLSPDGKILYQGRIDDQRGVAYKRKSPTRRDLVEAIEEVLAGKPVSVPKTEVAGCLIARAITPKETGTITYARHVSRILQDRCQECHRPGQVGPFSLLSYEDALSWQDMIREVVEEKRMPPWHADPKHGKFANDRSLSSQERETLLGWIKQGCPKGDEKDLPEPKKWKKGWMIGEPDVVFEMPTEFTVPAEAGPRGIRYQYFHVRTNFTEDRWIQAAESRPGSRETVHHIIVFIRDPSKMRDNKGGRIGDIKDGIGNGFLTAYAPGDAPLVLPPGYAKKLPKGAVLTFQMHYTPDGVERKDRSSVGLIFAKEPPKFEVRTRAIAQQYFNIPAGADNYEVKSRTTFDRDVTLLNFMPHMHLRGKDFKYDLMSGDNKLGTLLSVPRYDFGWQTVYRLDKPMQLPAGTKIECTAHFDNSVKNPNNPDPNKRVFWGEQTWEEMMIGFVDYAFENGPTK